MTDDTWEELTIDPQELRAGDVVAYLVKDYLARPGAPLVHRGDWEVVASDYISGTHIAVNDEGWAYDVEAVSFHCRLLESDRDEWKLFPLDQQVTIRRRAHADVWNL